MYKIMNINRTGLKAINNKIDNIADDLANIQTYGYKRKEVSFCELLTNEIYDVDVLKSKEINHCQIPMGVKSEARTGSFQQGVIVPSDSEVHLAIEGNGFFGVIDDSGNISLTRNGGFHRNEDNSITDDRGNRLSININIPPVEWGKGKLHISGEGEIAKADEDNSVILGNVVLYNPSAPESLIPIGEGRYAIPIGSEVYGGLGMAKGSIKQYALESSNVEIVKSMTDMIVSQRAYSLNIKALQTTDDIISIINDIKR